MKHLLSAVQEWQSLVKERNLLLFMDYDGTLTPIVESPDRANLSVLMKRILEILVSLRGIQLAVISGRSLKQLKSFVSIPALIHVGNHGLEVEGPGIKHVFPGRVSVTALMEEISGCLKKAFKEIPEIIVEDKTYTLSVHYRQVKKENIEQNWSRLLKILFPYLEQSQILLTQGKKVWEIRPATAWNKATAVLWLTNYFSSIEPKRSFLSMYVGDDQADEACFALMGHGGFGVRVTEDPSEPTNAEYYLRNHNEFYEFLHRVKDLKSKP